MISNHHNSHFDFSRGMYALITGSGAALADPDRGGASAAVMVDGHLLQFDCGRGVMESLCRAGINPLDVDFLFLTHLHFDHIANYGYFLISSWIGGRQSPLEVWGPPGTNDFSEKITHAHSIDAAFTEQIVDRWPATTPTRPRPDLPTTIHEFSSRGVVLSTDTFTVTSVETPHYREMGILSFGYRVDSAHGSVVVTGDGRPSVGMIELARGADLLIHECSKPDNDMIDGGKFSESNEGLESSDVAGWAGGHTTPSWLGEVAARAGVSTVVATHLPPLSAAPAAAEMSRLYTGGHCHGDEIWVKYEERIRKSFSGDVVIAEDGIVFAIGAASAKSEEPGVGPGRRYGREAAASIAISRPGSASPVTPRIV